MLINFFMTLKNEKLPVSFTELFTLLDCLRKNIVFGSVEDFYYLSRLCLIKDEKNFDKFDKAFSKYFKNVEILWASVREPYNYLQAKQLGCHIITIPPSIIEKIENFGKSFSYLTIDTVKKFLVDSKNSRFKI